MFNLFKKRRERVLPVLISIDNFQNKVLGSEKPVALMFTAAWCTACKMFKPIFIDLADENRNKGILLGMVDTEAQKELARELNIRSLPTLIIFHQGAPVYRGNMLPKMRLQELFDTLIEKNSQ